MHDDQLILPLTRKYREDGGIIEDMFWQFHLNNPHVYDLMTHETRIVKAAGFHLWSTKAAYERIRWLYQIERGCRKFKLNNNYTAYYARLIMEQESDLAGMFKIRELLEEK